jgi:hypothetical protein
LQVAHAVSVRRRIEFTNTLAWAAAGGVVLLLFLAAGVALSRAPLPLPLVLAFGFGLLGTLTLTLGRYDAAVAVGLLLFAVVRLEPAPPDLVFAVVIAVALVTARFRLQSVPLSATVLVSAFLALNLLAATGATDGARAVTFFGITFYLGVFALWAAAYVSSVRAARLVVVAYLAGAALSAAAACLALIVPFPGSDALVTGPRAQGLFKDPNVFGPFLVPAALILMEETVAPRLLRLRLPTKLVLLSVLTVGVVFSFSRAAWLNLAVGVLALLTILALRRGGARRAMTLLAVALVAGAALVAVLEATSMTGFLSQRAALQDYDSQRFGAQASGVEIAERHPLGVLGVLLVLGLLVLTLGFAARNVALGVDTYGIGSAALLAAWCGVLANSFFVDTLHWRHLWLVAALIWAGTALREGYPGR